MSNSVYARADGCPPLNGVPPSVYPYGISFQPYVPFPLQQFPFSSAMQQSMAPAIFSAGAGWPTVSTCLYAPSGTPNMEPAPPLPPSLPPSASFPRTKNTPVVDCQSGVGYILPKSYTMIHVIQPGPSPPGPFQFTAHQVPTSFTVSELIDQICVVDPIKGQKPVAKGIVELIERGDGQWISSSQFWVGGKRGRSKAAKANAALTLAEIGWNDTRGMEAAPVWLMWTVLFE